MAFPRLVNLYRDAVTGALQVSLVGLRRPQLQNLDLDAEPEWTEIQLGADVPTSSTTPIDTGLEFTPAANRSYLVECYMLADSAQLRTDLSFPTGLTDKGRIVQDPA